MACGELRQGSVLHLSIQYCKTENWQIIAAVSRTLQLIEGYILVTPEAASGI
jgi:hypothetical protein